MSLCRYRSATSGDADTIAAIVESAYRSTEVAGWTTEAHLVGGTRTSEDEITAAIQSDNSCLLIGELDEIIVSCCRLLSVGDAVHLSMFCVAPSRQGAGLGDELLRSVVAEARDRFGARRLTLQVISTRVELRRWYERHGFASTGERLPLSSAIDPALALVPGLDFTVYEREIGRPIIT